jgi:hypothetical protein
MVVFIPCTKDMNAVELAEAMESYIIRDYGMVESYVSEGKPVYVGLVVDFLEC